MSFLAPIWLVLSAAVAVPLMLHLMRRRIETRVEFPAARYLARAEKENIRRLKLRNLLLMALRTLALLFLALAAARPIAAMLGAGHVPTAVAIVLDNSLSTNVIVDGAPLLDRLKGAARALLAASESSDRLWLVTADGRVTGGTAASLAEAVDRTDAYGGRGDLAAALTRAGGLAMASGLEEQAVAVLTDGQATTWDANVALGEVRIVGYVPPVTPPANRAVERAEPQPARWTPRGAVLVRAAGEDSATYRVSLGERTLARGMLRGGDEVLVRAEPSVRGWIAGRVELSPDELRGDDERHFAVFVGDAPPVRVDAAAGPFAESAIEALAQSDRARRGSGIEFAPADRAERLPALLLAPSDPVRVGASNRTLERLGVPWRLGDARRDETVARGGELDGTTVRFRYPLRAVAGAVSDTVATAGGDAWIVAGPGYVLVGSPLSHEATDLPIRAPFIPWLADVLGQQLGAQGSLLMRAAPGKRVRFAEGTSGLESADGDTLAVPADSTAPARPGVYFLRRGEERIGALVVNVEPEESNLARLEARALADRLGRDAEVVTSVERMSEAVFASGSRRPLQAILLALALMCLAAEGFVVRRADAPGHARAA